MNEFLHRLRFVFATIYRAVGLLVIAYAWTAFLTVTLVSQSAPTGVSVTGMSLLAVLLFSFVGFLLFYLALWLAWISVPRIGSFEDRADEGGGGATTRTGQAT